MHERDAGRRLIRPAACPPRPEFRASGSEMITPSITGFFTEFMLSPSREHVRHSKNNLLKTGTFHAKSAKTETAPI
ncbi:hypothetical protein [Burkholderia ubonensis]|uniref:hypothetical protein n=1 Tax=Burkholderia ubonensis TaxID=101571 RepID=UPI0012F88E48|nr:hypothetical protein [Burkholderia ubonensis]